MNRVRLSGGAVAMALALCCAATVSAQAPQAPQTPAPDPNAWWTAGDLREDDALDPLGNRRWSKRDAQVRAGFNYGVDASLYRLWGLQPLQGLSLRRGETVMELWFRPTDSTRQAVIRAILRADGETFIQARAGRGCCSPEISRRVDINTQVSGDQRRALAQLRDDPAWDQPRNVEVSEAGDVVSSVCVDGASYDLTLITDRRASHIRRSCDPVELGSAAAVMKTLVDAARGFDPRFDVVFSGQRFDQYAQSYAQLVQSGGRVQAPPKGAREAQPAPLPPQFADERSEAEQAILAADRAFAARATSASAAQAFREFMDAEEGLLFRPDGEPIEGAELVFQHFGGAAAETGKLTWEPVQAWVSEAGDFGASWGRSRTGPLDPTRPAQAQPYITVWRKDAAGRWKGLMNMGASAANLATTGPVAPTRPAAASAR